MRLLQSSVNLQEKGRDTMARINFEARNASKSEVVALEVHTIASGFFNLRLICGARGTEGGRRRAVRGRNPPRMAPQAAPRTPRDCP